MYGHAYGDVALKVLSEGMQKFFDKNVLLGRNGGDEFCIFLPDCTCADVKEKLEKFTKLNDHLNMKVKSISSLYQLDMLNIRFMLTNHQSSCVVLILHFMR